MKVEKVMIHGIAYYHFHDCEDLKILCGRCCFAVEDKNRVKCCRIPFACEPNGFYTFYLEKPIETWGAKFVIDVPPPPEPDWLFLETHPEAAAWQRPTERSKEETGEDGKVKREGGIGKRSYYGFPNGVEAEDICRYLPFNLGNVVKYLCRAGRKDKAKKIEDLEKARDYLEDEIKRAKEELGNEIQGMKEKIAKENEGR